MKYYLFTGRNCLICESIKKELSDSGLIDFVEEVDADHIPDGLELDLLNSGIVITSVPKLVSRDSNGKYVFVDWRNVNMKEVLFNADE